MPVKERKMAHTSEQKLKVLYLYDILNEYSDENNVISMSDIIAHLKNRGINAERKSIYDDISLLNDVYGCKIEYRHGKHGGYRLIDRKFELSELKLLVDAVQASKFITEKKSCALIKKLESFSSRYQASQLQHSVIMRERIKTMNESVFFNVDAIQSAINANKQISFLYFDRNMKKERVYHKNGERYVVSPIALIWDDENYYLVASDESINKHYRVDKMEDITLSAKTAGPLFRKRFDTAKYSKMMFGMFGGETVNVTLLADEKLAGVFIDRFGQSVIFTPGDGNFTVTVEVALSPVFYSWVMQFGKSVKILSPEIAVKGISELAAEVLENCKQFSL